MPDHDTTSRPRMGRPPLPRPICPICNVKPLKRARDKFCGKSCSNRARAVPPLERFIQNIGPSRIDLSLSFEIACRDWQGDADREGYGLFSFSHERQLRAHRYAYALAAGLDPLNMPAGLDIAHTCDRPLCIQTDGVGTYEVRGRTFPRYGHLYGTDNEANTHDKIDKGRARYARGETHHSAKLTDVQIEQLCLDWAQGMSQTALAARYGISQPQVSRILNMTRRASE
jgi:hypothetical protein